MPRLIIDESLPETPWSRRFEGPGLRPLNPVLPIRPSIMRQSRRRSAFGQAQGAFLKPWSGHQELQLLRIDDFPFRSWGVPWIAPIAFSRNIWKARPWFCLATSRKG
jgi:hypothetical protein